MRRRIDDRSIDSQGVSIEREQSARITGQRQDVRVGRVNIHRSKTADQRSHRCIVQDTRAAERDVGGIVVFAFNGDLHRRVVDQSVRVNDRILKGIRFRFAGRQVIERAVGIESIATIGIDGDQSAFGSLNFRANRNRGFTNGHRHDMARIAGIDITVIAEQSSCQEVPRYFDLRECRAVDRNLVYLDL
ncbi:hypothetical protein Pla52n_68860 [Stieleria varia]|uniref:Uncharacterized protein n=1 Tax=Stieleria varia TaxID=2528005 RepID=A0A5C5ZP20_9BACT|nr:hypothetical protein Pla52n_68860 [Stieleria varia]